MNSHTAHDLDIKISSCFTSILKNISLIEHPDNNHIYYGISFYKILMIFWKIWKNIFKCVWWCSPLCWQAQEPPFIFLSVQWSANLLSVTYQPYYFSAVVDHPHNRILLRCLPSRIYIQEKACNIFILANLFALLQPPNGLGLQQAYFLFQKQEAGLVILDSSRL